MSSTMNELTFAGWLVEFTTLRSAQIDESGGAAFIASAAIEERQRDENGVVRRCDIRFNTRRGRKLASGELKRPEISEGRDPRNEALRQDARRKALARGLPYYFTCNIRETVLFEVAERADSDDVEVFSIILAKISSSAEAGAHKAEIQKNWNIFLDFLESRLAAAVVTRPSVTTADVVALRDAIFTIAEEAAGRAARFASADPTRAEEIRDEAVSSFNFPASLNPHFAGKFAEEITQILRFGAFVVAQKLILYRVLQEAGPRRTEPFQLDALSVPRESTDPQAIWSNLNAAFSLAMRRSGDYETAFLPKPFLEVLFAEPEGLAETEACEVGEVWHNLLAAIGEASWVSISQNVVGLLYEVIVEERFRHQLGQFYTPEDVVDILTTHAVRTPGDLVLDPSTGGGSFLRSAYMRKRALGATHQRSLADLWGCEITAFAALLSTVTLATADVTEPAAYPRVILSDFFAVRPGLVTNLEIPGEVGNLTFPQRFDAVVGNPPYISYRHLTNQSAILNALAVPDETIRYPKFSGKSDAYLWFIVHATRFLAPGGRLSFVISSGILFSDYGIPLIRFLGHHFKINAVVESMVERWFPEADTNTVLLFLEREYDQQARSDNVMRFVRLRRPLAQLLPPPASPDRREVLEDLVDRLLTQPVSDSDPVMHVNAIIQGNDGGLSLSDEILSADLLDEESEVA
jgi:hypothetical protein